MRHVRLVLVQIVALLAALVAAPALAQVGTQRVGDLVYSRATVGTTTAAATSSVATGIIGWKICADSANTNYLAVGEAADADTDGVRLLAGSCLECLACTGKTLSLTKVKGGAAGQGYSLVQYKAQ